jgi:hypothetical protein
MRKLLLLAAGLGAAAMVRKRAAEQGVPPMTLIGNSIERGLAWLTALPERMPAPKREGKA